MIAVHRPGETTHLWTESLCQGPESPLRTVIEKVSFGESPSHEQHQAALVRQEKCCISRDFGTILGRYHQSRACRDFGIGTIGRILDIVPSVGARYHDCPRIRHSPHSSLLEAWEHSGGRCRLLQPGNSPRAAAPSTAERLPSAAAGRGF